MTSDEGPWGSRTPAPPAPPPRAPLDRRQLLLWALFLAGLGGIVVAMAKSFPEAMRTQDDWSDVGYYALFLVLLATGAFRARRWGGPRQIIAHAAIWVAVAAALALGYAYRQELAGIPGRLQLEIWMWRPSAYRGVTGPLPRLQSHGG